MINFYLSYGSVQTLSGQLNWSHYCELLSISDKDKRHFYEVECQNTKWSVRELRRQTSSSLLFERLLLSNGDANLEKCQKSVKNQIPKMNEPMFEFVSTDYVHKISLLDTYKNKLRNLGAFHT